MIEITEDLDETDVPHTGVLPVLLFFSAAQLRQAQGQDSQVMSGRAEMSLKALKLTDEQMIAARQIKANYTKRLLKLRSDIIAKRIEFAISSGIPPQLKK